MYIRGHFLAADTPYNIIRCIIVQDKTTGTSAPTVATLFANSVYPYYSPLNRDYRDTYNVLVDKTVIVSNDGASTTGYVPRTFKFNIPGKKLRSVNYTNAGAVDSGTIWICLISDSTVSVHPSFVMISRTFYRDD